MQLKINIFWVCCFVTFGFSQFMDSTYTNLPLSKKILWGENGLIRKFECAPKTKVDELKLRHKMLKTHQKFGLLTLGMMAYQSYLGMQLWEEKIVDASICNFIFFSRRLIIIEEIIFLSS